MNKFYSQRAIGIATFLGGPLAAGYLIKRNYDALEQRDNAMKALLFGIVVTVLLFAGIFAIPDNILDKIPNALLPAVYTGIIYLIVERLQGDILRKHKESGGTFHSGWKAAGVGAISLLFILAAIFIPIFKENGSLAFDPDFDAHTYDSEIARFVENENRALAVFDALESETPEYLMTEFSKGINLWKENKEIIAGLDSLENLPQTLVDQNSLLLRYCDLRVQHHEFIIKAISEETDQYAPEIDRIGSEIFQVLEDLN